MEQAIKFVHFTDKPSAALMCLSFCQLSWDFRHEQHLLFKTPFQFWRQFQRGLTVIAFCRRQIVGHITLWHLQDDWYESGSFWVHPKFRHFGIGCELKRRLMAKGRHLNVLSTTTNDIVKKMNIDFGIKAACFSDLPPEIYQATCTCSPEKMKAPEYCLCRLKDKECHLFVTYAKKTLSYFVV